MAGSNRAVWHQFINDDSPQLRAKWRTITENTAKTFIRTAKNERYHPYQINARLAKSHVNNDMALTWMLAGIYDRYANHHYAAGGFRF